MASAYDATKVSLFPPPPPTLSPISVGLALTARCRSLQHTAEETVEKAKETGSSWFGWGSSKAEENKKDAANKVEQGADKVKSEAQKRQ